MGPANLAQIFILIGSLIAMAVPANAQEIKVRSLPFELQQRPFYYDRALYLVTKDNSIAKLSTRGQFKWQTPLPVRNIQAILPRFNTLYLVDKDHHITKMDAMYGYIKGVMTEDTFTNIHLTSAFIYYLDLKGQFRIRSAQSGSLIWAPSKPKFTQITLLKNLDYLVGVATQGLFLINPYDQNISRIKAMSGQPEIIDGGWDNWILLKQGQNLLKLDLKSKQSKFVTEIKSQEHRIYDGYILAEVGSNSLKITNLKTKKTLWRAKYITLDLVPQLTPFLLGLLDSKMLLSFPLI